MPYSKPGGEASNTDKSSETSTEKLEVTSKKHTTEITGMGVDVTRMVLRK